MKRLQARRGNGRFTGNTMENTLGLHTTIHERKADGEWCGALNPSRVGEPRPETCSHCGEPLNPDPPSQILRPGHTDEGHEEEQSTKS